MSDKNGRLGIIGAMAVEVDLLRSHLEQRHDEQCLGMDVSTGELCGTPVVVVRCGIGKVNAASCAQMLVLRYGVTAIVNTGVAGSLDASIDIGDVVVSTDAVQHDMDVAGLGYEPGFVPGLGLSFAADDRLRERAVAAVRAVAPDVGVHQGRVASGDQFVSSAKQKERIVQTFGALCCEMEGAAIAQTCSIAQVPFVVVRAISDKADGSAHVDYPTFEAEAAAHCARIVEHMAQGMWG